MWLFFQNNIEVTHSSIYWRKVCFFKVAVKMEVDFKNDQFGQFKANKKLVLVDGTV